MSKKILKLLPIWSAIVCVIVIAGIVLMALLGFNNAADHPENLSLEVGYDISIDIDEEKTAALEKACADAFAAQGISPAEEKISYGMSTSQDWTVRTYTFTKATREQLVAAKAAIEQALEGSGKTDVQVHENTMLGFTEVIWRGGVAIAVGVIVGLIYLAIRFGVGCALTGLTASAVGGVLPVCLIAITRIPVYSAAPVFYAAVGAFVTLLLWLVQCMKLRDLKKSDARQPAAEEAVLVTAREACSAVVALCIALVALLLIVGCVASAGVRALVLPALVSVAAAAFAVLVFAPALHVPVKAAFDRLAAKRKPRYLGKKSEKEEAETETDE